MDYSARFVETAESMRVEGRCGTAVRGGTNAALIALICAGSQEHFYLRCRTQQQPTAVRCRVCPLHAPTHMSGIVSALEVATYTAYPGPEPMQMLSRSRICRRHHNTEATKAVAVATKARATYSTGSRHFSRNDWHSWSTALLSSRTTTTDVPDMLWSVIGTSWCFLEVPPFLG